MRNLVKQINLIVIYKVKLWIKRKQSLKINSKQMDNNKQLKNKKKIKKNKKFNLKKKLKTIGRTCLNQKILPVIIKIILTIIILPTILTIHTIIIMKTLNHLLKQRLIQNHPPRMEIKNLLHYLHNNNLKRYLGSWSGFVFKMYMTSHKILIYTNG